MSDVQQSELAPKEIPNSTCLAIGVGFIVGLVALIILARVFGSS